MHIHKEEAQHLNICSLRESVLAQRKEWRTDNTWTKPKLLIRQTSRPAFLKMYAVVSRVWPRCGVGVNGSKLGKYSHMVFQPTFWVQSETFHQPQASAREGQKRELDPGLDRPARP